MKSAVDSLQKGVKLLALGVDPERYRRFLTLVPAVALYQSGGHSTQWLPRHTPDILNSANFEFCLNFVIDTALELQRRGLRIVR